MNIIFLKKIFRKTLQDWKTNFQIEWVHWASTQWMKIDPGPGTSLKFHNLGAEKIQKNFKERNSLYWRNKHQNGFRFLNSNTGSKRTVKHCFQNPDEKFIFNLEFSAQTLKWIYRIFVDVFRLKRSWQFFSPCTISQESAGCFDQKKSKLRNRKTETQKTGEPTQETRSLQKLSRMLVWEDLRIKLTTQTRRQTGKRGRELQKQAGWRLGSAVPALLLLYQCFVLFF